MCDIHARLVHDCMQGEPRDAAMDSTDIEFTNASTHFVSKMRQKRRQFMRLCMVILCSLLLPASMRLEWDPRDGHRHAKFVAPTAHNATPLGLLWCDMGQEVSRLPLG